MNYIGGFCIDKMDKNESLDKPLKTFKIAIYLIEVFDNSFLLYLP